MFCGKENVTLPVVPLTLTWLAVPETDVTPLLLIVIVLLELLTPIAVPPLIVMDGPVCELMLVIPPLEPLEFRTSYTQADPL